MGLLRKPASLFRGKLGKWKYKKKMKRNALFRAAQKAGMASGPALKLKRLGNIHSKTVKWETFKLRRQRKKKARFLRKVRKTYRKNPELLLDRIFKIQQKKKK